MAQTQPGTLQHRFLEWLRAQAKATGNPHAQYATATVCEALDAELTSFANLMLPLRNAGVVKAERIPGKGMPFWWSLGDGEAAPPRHDEEPPRRTAPELQPRPGVLLPGIAAGGAGKPVAPPAPELQPEPERLTPDRYIERVLREYEGKASEAASMPFNACRYVDGSVIVVGVEVREDGAIIFSPGQAQKLWKLRDAA